MTCSSCGYWTIFPIKKYYRLLDTAIFILRNKKKQNICIECFKKELRGNNETKN